MSALWRANPKALMWLERCTWVLIFGGLLALVLGLFVQRSQAVLGWWMIWGGSVVAALGIICIFIRSKFQEAS